MTCTLTLTLTLTLPLGELGFELVACDVHIEGRAAPPAAAQTLLDGKLQVRYLVITPCTGGCSRTALSCRSLMDLTPHVTVLVTLTLTPTLARQQAAGVG